MTRSVLHGCKQLLRWLLALSLVALSFAGISTGHAQGSSGFNQGGSGFNQGSSSFNQGSSGFYETLNRDDGLSQQTVTALIQDETGFLWVGTQSGLNRYDGHEFRVWQSQQDNTNSLSDAYITSLVAAGDQLWIATNNGGLNLLDTASDHISSWQHDVNRADSLSHNRVLSLLKQDQVLWIGTEVGLDRMHIGQAGMQRIAWPAASQRSAVQALLLDDEATLWVGTARGLYYLPPGTNQLMVAPGAPALSIHALASSSDGLLLLGTDQGLWRYDRTARHSNRWAWPDNAATAALQIDDLLFDSSGTLWLATRSGVWQIAAQTTAQDHSMDTWTQNRRSASDAYSLPEDIVKTLFEDRNANLWIGTYGGGLSKRVPHKSLIRRFVHDPTRPDSLAQNIVFPILEDRQGQVWVGTYNRGLDRLDPSSGQVQHYRHAAADPDSLGGDEVRALLEDRHGVLWVGGNHAGLSRFDPESSTFATYRHADNDANSLSSDWVVAITEADANALWVGTWGGGLNHFTVASGEFTAYRHDPDNPNSLSHDRVMTVLQDPDGMVWIGTDGGGLNRFDPQRGTFQHYRHIANEPNSLSHNSVESIYRDAAGHLWLATLAGLDRLDPVTGQFRHYQQQHGLADNMTMCVTADAQGQLWITTNSGLSRLNPRTDQFRNFGSSDGLGGNEFNSFGCHYGRSGNLYVGAVHGLNMIPTRLADAPRTTAPQVVLTGLRLFNQPLDIQPGALLATRIDRLSELTLAHSQSMVSFEFSALDYASPQAVRYAYQMTGVDDRWIETSAAQRRATYTNLPVGRHLLKLRARTEVTDWTAQPAQLAVVVLPPWWLSWWAYALYALICGMLIFGVLRYFAARHAERMKSRFLAMMSHEIRNPLDGLLGSIELLRNAHLTSMHHEQMHTIQNAAEALLAVLDDLLDFSRAESGKLVFKMAPFNLRHLLNSQLDLIRTGATSKRLQLDLQVDQRIPEWLNGDANRLRQVLLNLLGNAVKFTDFGHIRLTVDQQSVSADRIQLHFAISDTGKGISADLQQRIFEPYHQVQASESARFRGAGLGLAVCKQLISAQHGAIGVDSIPGQGSTFWFELTFATNVSAPTLVTDDVAHNRQARRILLVEDVALNRSINSSLLEQSGHRVCCAENGKMARQILAEDAGFDVILMDVNMPEEDGITATVTIRNTAKPELAAIPIIGLTGQLNQDCIDRCEQAGMDRILAKPLRMADFNNALQALCQKSTNTAAPQHATARAALLDQAMIDSHQQVLGAERWQQIVELFVTTAADELQTLSAQLADADQAAAGATAHRLAGAVAGMGGVALQLALQQLESLLIEEQTAELHSDRIRDLVAEIQALNQQTCSALLQTK